MLTRCRWLLAISVGVGGLVAGAVGGVGGSAQAPRVVAIQVDFAYDVGDPGLVAGDAAFVVAGEVESYVRRVEDRSIIRVRVLDELKGSVPKAIQVSQLGYVDGETTYELEGFPLMKEGDAYILALVAPAEQEPQDALILLSAQKNGNKVRIASLLDPAVETYKAAIAAGRRPYGSDSGPLEERATNAKRWSRLVQVDG